MLETCKIFTVDVDEALRIAANVNNPHRHDYEELIIGVAGELEHFIDFNTEIVAAPYVSFVTKGKVHRLYPRVANGACFAWVIRFQSEFIGDTTFQLYAQYHENANLKWNNDRNFQRLVTLCEMMYDEMQSPVPDLAIVKGLLSTLLIMVASERKRQQTEMSDVLTSGSITFKNFLALLEENFRRNVGVSYYASQLFMSTRNLNKICNNIVQQSVSEMIETRKLLEAKNLLTTSEKTIAEIAFEIGYTDPSHFTAVFKKKSGVTPSEFREDMKKQYS